MGPWQLLAARFVYGTKSASMIFWGLHGLSFRRFLLIDSIGCVLGSLVFTSLGYLLSGSATVLLGHVKRVELWLLGAAIVGVVVVFSSTRPPSTSCISTRRTGGRMDRRTERRKRGRAVRR